MLPLKYLAWHNCNSHCKNWISKGESDTFVRTETQTHTLKKWNSASCVRTAFENDEIIKWHIFSGARRRRDRVLHTYWHILMFNLSFSGLEMGIRHRFPFISLCIHSVSFVYYFCIYNKSHRSAAHIRAVSHSVVINVVNRIVLKWRNTHIKGNNNIQVHNSHFLSENTHTPDSRGIHFGAANAVHIHS